MTITSAKELAAKAADEIERRGWHDGDLSNNPSDPKGCKVCVLGATGAAYFGDPEAGYGFPRDEHGVPASEPHCGYLNLIDEIEQAVTPAAPDRTLPTTRLYRWNDTYVASQFNPQDFIIGELRRYAESEAA